MNEVKEIDEIRLAASTFLMSKSVAWDDQRAFLAVLEEGSLSAAARRLGVAQPTVRVRIEALEHSLATVLFTRSANGLVPTDQAKALGESARSMAHASDAFVRAASAPPGEVAGVVRISVSDFVGIAVLPPMLASLRSIHPKLIVEVALSNASADLLEQEVDIAVRMHPPRHDALVAKKIGTIELGLFAHPDYLARRGTPVSPADLAAHDFIGPDRDRADLQLAATLNAFVTREQFVIRADSHPAQLAAARAGVGIAVVQRPIGRADPLLRPVLSSMTIASLDTWIVTHENLRRLPRVNAVFDHLVEGFSRFVQLGVAMV